MKISAFIKNKYVPSPGTCRKKHEMCPRKSPSPGGKLKEPQIMNSFFPPPDLTRLKSLSWIFTGFETLFSVAVMSTEALGRQRPAVSRFQSTLAKLAIGGETASFLTRKIEQI